MTTYNSILQSNNEDLQAILDTIDTLPEGGGVTIQKKTGTFTTNSNGSATITGLGFQPDLIAIDGGTDALGGRSYVGAMFTEANLSSVNIVTTGPSSSYIMTSLSLIRNSGGFSVNAIKYSTSLTTSNDTNRTFSYVAIKYTK